MKEQTRSKILLAGTMTIFGTIGLFRRYITLSSPALAMARGFIGAISLFLVMLAMGKRPSVRDIRHNWKLLLASGMAMGFDWLCLFEAYNHTSVAVATLCEYMSPVFVIMASPFVLHEKITLKKALCVLTAVIGMVFVSGVLKGDGQTGYLGVLLALGCAVFYAAVVLMNKKLGSISAYDKTVVQLAIAGAVLLPYVLLTEKPGGAALTPLVIGLVLLLGSVHTGITYAIYFGCVDRLPTQTVALFSYIDPIVAVLISALVLSEPLGLYEIIGIVCILCATLISELPERV